MPLPADITAYHRAQRPADRVICQLLAKEIDAALPDAERKVWHRHPVWFLGGNPIVGYAKRKAGVCLLFWSGQSFAEPGLTPEGTFKAAEIHYERKQDVDAVALRRWLGKARTIQWDYKNIAKRKGRLVRLGMTGKASAAKAAAGDAPVLAYIASLPPAQRAIAERVDALAAKTLPGVQRAVKWGMAYYGVDGGWCFSCGAFAGHVKLMFIRGTELRPEPPVTPIGMGKATRGVELASVAELDTRRVSAWMKQAAANPFVGGKQQR